MRLPFRVIDFHAHFAYGFNFPRAHPLKEEYGRERFERMCEEWDFPDRESFTGTAEELALFWEGELDRYNLDKVVFMTGGGNDTLASVVAPRPGFVGFAHHPIDVPGAADELRRAVEELGLSGLKVFAPRVSIPFEDPQFEPLWTYAAEKRLPVLIHFGLLGTANGVVYHPRMSPLTLYEVARRYPEIPFVIPHLGCGYPQELLQLGWSCHNIYVDTSGSNQWMRWMPYPLDLESLLRRYYETFGPQRILFGSDSSWLPRGFVHRYLQDQVRACRYLAFKEEDIYQIFRGNALRLLGLPEE